MVNESLPQAGLPLQCHGKSTAQASYLNDRDTRAS